MTKYCIDSSNFHIHLQFKVFESDIKYPSNTILTVSVNSDGFCANADMDIDIKQFAIFVDDLTTLYSTLDGIAIIQEPYSEEQFIKFSADRTGHIDISGKLHSRGHNTFTQSLSFENRIDQTYLPEFLSNLSAFCSKYR